MQEQRFLEAYQGRAVLQRRMHAPQGRQLVWHRKLFPFTALAEGPLYCLQPGLRGDGPAASRPAPGTSGICHAGAGLHK